MPGPPPKAKNRQRRNNRTSTGKQVAEITATDLIGRPDAPPPDPRWGDSDYLVAEWNAAWASPVAATWNQETDLATLRRLFDIRYEIECMEAAVGSNYMVKGSTGQDVVHPLIKERDSLRDQALKLEDRVGLSPMARLKLGVELGRAADSLEQMNAGLDGELDDDDPRFDDDVIDVSA